MTLRINRRRCACGGLPGGEVALRLPRATAGSPVSLISPWTRLTLVVRDDSAEGQGRLAGVSLVSLGMGRSPLPPSLLVVVDNAVVLVAPELSVGGC